MMKQKKTTKMCRFYAEDKERACDYCFMRYFHLCSNVKLFFFKVLIADDINVNFV